MSADSEDLSETSAVLMFEPKLTECGPERAHADGTLGTHGVVTDAVDPASARNLLLRPDVCLLGTTEIT